MKRLSRSIPAISADEVLHHLVHEGEVVEVRRRKWLVAPLNYRLIDEIVTALASTEDDEDNNDAEASLGDGNDDLEGDGNCDAEPDADDEPSPDCRLTIIGRASPVVTAPHGRRGRWVSVR